MRRGRRARALAAGCPTEEDLRWQAARCALVLERHLVTLPEETPQQRRALDRWLRRKQRPRYSVRKYGRPSPPNTA